MNEPIKTLVFVVAASLMAGLVGMSQFLNRPTNAADFELVGKPFFEDFTSASQAQSLRVAAVDPLTGERRRFSIEKKSELWTIPSHFNYPAEAAERLARTASSVIGIERESLEGRLVSEHERLGVVDPLSDDLDDPETAGKRITLKRANGDTIVDLIIGKQADDNSDSSDPESFDDAEAQKYFYVRRPDEKQTYRVALDLDLSARFKDWIDPDLLQVERNELKRININNFVLRENGINVPGQVAALVKVQGDRLALSRNTPTDPWTLDDINLDTETFQAPRANEILGALDELTIVGVRPKFRFKGQLLLTPDLKVFNRPEFRENRQEFADAQLRLQRELQKKGFNLVGTNQRLDLVSQNGEIQAGTSEGVLYTIHIGKPIDGSEHEIEIGSDATSDEPPGTADDAAVDSNGSDSNNRFLMIRVALDQSLIEGRPVEPLQPTAPLAPEGYVPFDPSEAQPERELNPDDDAAPAPDQAPPRDSAFVMHDKALNAYGELQIEYELALTKFEVDAKKFAVKVESGQQKVDELNERFGAWYYVVSANKLETLQSKRHDLVSPKDPPQGNPGKIPPAPLPTLPDISFPELPNK